MVVSHDGLFAKDPDSFRYCGRIIFHSKHGLGSDLIKLNGAWRMNMPLVHLKVHSATYQIRLLPCSYADRPYYLLAILLQSWNGGSRYQRIGPGKCVFTFLVNFSTMSDVHVEQLWVDRWHWLPLHRKSLKDKNIEDYRSIRIRIKTNQDDWHFLSADHKDSTWSPSNMVLQLQSILNLGRCAAHLGLIIGIKEQILLSFEYRTGSQINFAFQLPMLPDVQLFDSRGAFESRLLVFVGDKSEENWAARFKQVLDRLPNARDTTPCWSIQASVTTRRVFNQLITTLEITDTKNVRDSDLVVGALMPLKCRDDFESEIERVKEEWQRLNGALFPGETQDIGKLLKVLRTWEIIK
jgi:hypothetical protein